MSERLHCNHEKNEKKRFTNLEVSLHKAFNKVGILLLVQSSKSSNKSTRDYILTELQTRPKYNPIYDKNVYSKTVSGRPIFLFF